MIRKLVNTLCLVTAVLTSIAIICTLLTTYQFIYVGQSFNTYRPIQIGIIATMTMWSIKFLIFENGERRKVYGVFCIVVAILAVIFIAANVR